MAQMVKRLPAVRETQIRSLGQVDPLEKEMATHSSTLAWKIPWIEEPDRLSCMGVTKSQTRLSDFTFTKIILEMYVLCLITVSQKIYFMNFLFLG